MKILLFSPVNYSNNIRSDEHLFDMDKFCIIGVSFSNVTIGIIIDGEWMWKQ